MKPCLAAISLLLLPMCSWAFPYFGQIVDDITGEGLPGAEITSQSQEKTRSGPNGFFHLECQSARVAIRFPGYQEKSATLNPQDNHISLKVTGVYEIQAVAVTAKPDAKKVVVSKQSVPEAAMQKTTVGLYPDISRVVQLLPGVTSNGDFSALLYVRGGNPDEVVSSLDGMVMMDPYMWGGRLSVFNPNLVDSIDFYAGGFPAEAAQAMSAYLRVKNRIGNPDQLTGFADLSSATADLVAEGPCFGPAGSSFLFGFRRTYYDFFANQFSNPEDNQHFPYFYDGQLKLNLPFKDGTLVIQSIFSEEGMDLMPGRLSNDDGYGSEHSRDTRFNYLLRKQNSSVSYDYSLTENVRVFTLIGIRNETMNYSYTDFYQPSSLDGGQYYLQLQHAWQILPTDRHIIKTGIYGITGMGDFNLNQTVKIATPAGYYLDQITATAKVRWPLFIGGFIQDDIELLKNILYVNPGINSQYLSLNQQWVSNPRVAIKYKLSPDAEVHAATGLYSQHPFEYELLDSKYGNPHLLAEEALHYIIGGKLDLGADFSLQAEAYYKDYRHLYVKDADPGIRYTNHGLGYAYGADFILQKKISSHWDGWLTYSYLDARRKITERSNPVNFGLNPSLEPLDAWYRADSDRPHTLNLVLNYSITQAWKIALTQKYMTGKPYTPVVGASYQPAIDEYIPHYGEYNSARFPDFVLTDIKISMPFFGAKNWSSYIQLSNAFDAKNVDEYAYKKDYSDKKAVYQLPRMVIGGVRYDF